MDAHNSEKQKPNEFRDIGTKLRAATAFAVKHIGRYETAFGEAAKAEKAARARRLLLCHRSSWYRFFFRSP